MVQLSHPYMTTEKNIALTIQTFVGEVMAILFNTRSPLLVLLIWRTLTNTIILFLTVVKCYGIKRLILYVL